MIADGVLDDPKLDLILGYHNWPAVQAGKVGYNAGAVMSAADAFDITLKGRDGHGAHPHLAVDALAAGAHFVAQLQTVVSREVKPISPAVVTVGEFHAGRARNVIAGTAELKGIVRTLEPGLSEKIEAAVRRMLEGIKTGMRVDYTLDWKRMAPAAAQRSGACWKPFCAAPARRSATDNVLRAARAVDGQRGLRLVRRAACRRRTCASARRSTASIPRSTAPNYDCNELAIPVGVRVLARAVLDLADGALTVKWFDLSRTVVLPLHCDGYGHMNVRHYAAFFDDAGWHILAMAGISLGEVQAPRPRARWSPR